MKAIVLAGGFATRLRPLTLTKPKPLLPILNRPLLDWTLEALKRSGVEEVYLAVRYLSDMIRRRYGDGSALGVSITYEEEVRPLGDAGPIRVIAEKHGFDDTFLVVYGDVFTDMDVARLVEFHRSKGAEATMSLVEVEDPSRYGVAVLDEDGRVVGFVEKPRRGEAPSRLVNAGVYVFEPGVVKHIPRGPSKIARELLPRLVEQGVLYGYVHRGMWSDIGVPKDYMRANMEALRRYHPRGYIDEGAEVSGDAEIVHPVFVARGASVGPGAKLGPFAIVGEGARVGPSVRISNSIVFGGATIECCSVVSGGIVGERCYIGRWVRLEPGTVLGDEVVINDEVFLARNVVVLPFKEVESSVYEEGRVIL